MAVVEAGVVVVAIVVVEAAAAAATTRGCHTSPRSAIRSTVPTTRTTESKMF